MKKFNTTAVCIPSKHYMVDLSDLVEAIRKMVDEGEYFTINRARQYGKTTTIAALKRVLEKQYIVLSLDSQGNRESWIFHGRNICPEIQQTDLEQKKSGCGNTREGS